MFEAAWTGCYPCLCFGEWIIKKDGKDVSDAIPDDLRHYHMNTEGTYERWYFDDNYSEVFESYEDGLGLYQWIEQNPWIDRICHNEEEKQDLFYAISGADFRPGSCGGCI